MVSTVVMGPVLPFHPHDHLWTHVLQVLLG